MQRHRTRTPSGPRNRRGAALVAVLLVALGVCAIIVVASGTTMNARLVQRNSERSVIVYNAAISGVEEVRSKVNGTPTLMPDSGYVVMENTAVVRDASGAVIPHLRRTTWVGPTGNTSGQYGVFANIISLVEDHFGNRALHRGEVYQETFAKFAYFTDSEGGINFGGGDQIFGPTHSNDKITILTSGAVFKDHVTTHKTISGAQYGVFDRGYAENVAKIPLPPPQALEELKALAEDGNLSFMGHPSAGNAGQATIRVDFVPIEIAGVWHGFIRVWQASGTGAGPLNYAAGMGTATNTPNCGAGDPFVPVSTVPSAQRVAHMQQADARCYLGGDPRLTNGFVPANGNGAWLPWTGPVHPAIAGRPDAGYLHPISRTLNPEFKGVVFVDGKAIVSGTVRGRVTVASPHNIIIGDDIVLHEDPGLGGCDDLLALFSGKDVVVSNNFLNTPQQVGAGNWRSLDDTKDMHIHAIILALNRFLVQDHTGGPVSVTSCEAYLSGRGCLYLTGGVIQKTRGPVGTLSYDHLNGETGFIKRYSYNACGTSDPPPYFPTTNRFAGNHIYELDPVIFDLDSWFRTPSRRSSLLWTPPPPEPKPPKPPSPPPPPSPPKPPAPPKPPKPPPKPQV